MAVKTINTEMLQKMFLAGAANLEAKKDDADDHVSSKRSKG